MSTDSETPAYQDKHTLRRLYHEEGLTLEQIADRLGTTKATVSRWCRRHDIDTDGHGKRNQYSDDDLLDALREVAETTVGRPTKREFNAADGPSASPVEKRFGSWTAGLDAAEIKKAPSSGRNTLEKGLGTILKRHSEDAQALLEADAPFFAVETDLSERAIQIFSRAGIIEHATQYPVANAALEDSDSYCWQWEPADGVVEWVREYVNPRGQCPAEDCRATGISNPPEIDGYRCSSEECDRVLTEAEAKEVLGG